MFIYYVYAYLRKDGTPYYIGKGKNRREFAKHNVRLPKDRSLIVYLETNLSEIGALALERRYILWYGRKDTKTGMLRNKTDGGEGSSGAVQTQADRMKKSAAAKKRWEKSNGMPEETKNKIREKRALQVITDEAKAKMSLSKTGKTRSAESIAKTVAANTGRKRSNLTKVLLSSCRTLYPRKECEYCGLVAITANYNRWHGSNCKHAQ